MSDKRILSDPDREQAARMVALFSVLIHAWMTNEFDDAAEAKHDLDAMGVTVRLPRRKGKRKATEARRLAKQAKRRGLDLRTAADDRQGVADGK